MSQKSIKTQKSACWYFVNRYLAMIHHMQEPMCDEVFKSKLQDLENYVEGILMPTYDGDIIDTYVIIEQEAEA